MTSTRERQRAAARARLEKEMAERAARARKRRQTQAAIGGAVGLLLIIAGTVWLVSSFGDDDTSRNEASGGAAVQCAWNEAAPEQRTPQMKDVGLPVTQQKNSGTQIMTIDTNLGKITTKVDLARTPCTAASFTHLASKKFFDNTKCHRLTTAGIKVLQCGDPSATGKGWRPTDGQGGPTYRFGEENLPKGQQPTYPEGTIAMAKTMEPGSTGSQFFIVYGEAPLPPEYTVLGKITDGLDIVKQVAAAGTDNANQEGDGHPKKEIVIKTLTMSPIQG